MIPEIPRPTRQEIRNVVTFWSCVFLLVGMVIGASIVAARPAKALRIAADTAAVAPDPWQPIGRGVFMREIVVAGARCVVVQYHDAGVAVACR